MEKHQDATTCMYVSLHRWCGLTKVHGQPDTVSCEVKRDGIHLGSEWISDELVGSIVG
jgi:hypothetical protein